LCNTFLHWTIFKERSQGAILRIKTLANKRFVNYLVRFASSEHRGLLACLKTPLILHHGVVFQATRRALTSIRTWSGEPDIDTGHLPRFGQRHRLRTDQQRGQPHGEHPPLEKAPTCCFACPYFKGGFYPLAAPADSSEPVIASRTSTFSLGAGPSSSSPALSASSAPSSALPDPDRHKPMFKLPGSSAPSDPDRHKPAFKLSVLRAF
jgi:hypothetical protein